MGYVDVNAVSFALADGRPLLDAVTFRVPEGAKVALVGPNGTGKTTLLRIVAGDVAAHEGSATVNGRLGVMRQFIGQVRDDSTIRDICLGVSPPRVREVAARLDAAELAMMEADDEAIQMGYAQALADWADAGGYDAENLWDVCTTAALHLTYDVAKYREVRTLSGGEQKRLVLEVLLRGSDSVLVLDEPDNYLDVPGKRWLEQRLQETPKTVLFVSHDRELLANAATHIATLEPHAAGATSWIHHGGFRTYEEAREERNSRLDELNRRWEEDRAKLKALVLMYKLKAKYNDGMASRYQAAQTRLAKFEEAGPPQQRPRVQSLKMRLTGSRTAKRAVICSGLELSGLVAPFDLEIWYGERVAVLGANGSGKSHFLRLLALGGSDPDIEHQPVEDLVLHPVEHRGTLRLGARVRPGWFAQTHEHPQWTGRSLLDILHRGDDHRVGLWREAAAKALDRYELAAASEQTFETLSGGQQARFQILLLELSGATLLLLDEPTDNLDLHSGLALEQGLAAFDGTVVAVTHDRWFARGFDRFLRFTAAGEVVESPDPQFAAG